MKAQERSATGDGTARDLFIKTNLDELFRFWLVRACLLGSVIFVCLAGLDYIVARQHFQVFFLYRLAAAAVLIAVGLSTRFARQRSAVQALGFLVIIASAVAIELMILRFGGHTSIYYPGMILLGVVVFGIFPAGTKFHLAAAGAIYGIYLVPILFGDSITDLPYFLTANVFIVGIFLTSVLLRHLYHRGLRSQLGLQFDLEEHRQRLEEDVRGRTEQLSRAVVQLRQEVAERERSEEEIISVLNEWKATFDAARAMILLLDRDLKIRKLNRAAADFLGLEYRQAIDRPFLDLLGENDTGGEEHPLVKSARSRQHEEAEIYLPAKNAWLMASVDPVFSKKGEWVGAVHYLHDITYVHTMQKQIGRAKAEWEETFDVINDAITIHDDRFRVVRANRAACELLGSSMEDILKRRCFESYHGSTAPPDACPSCEVLRNGSPCTSEIFEPHLAKHLEVKALPKFDRDGRVNGLVHIVRDISLRKQAEEQQAQLQSQLQQAQKMESIGRLAGGVAHDFNNILFAMLGYAELAAGKVPEDHPVQKSLRVIRESGERAATLNRQLLAFSRKQVLNCQSMSLGSTIEKMGAMLERLIGEEIAFRMETAAQTRAIHADVGQVEQVVMNLAINARDALKAGGEILLSARDRDQPGKARVTNGIVEPGMYVELSVTDNGCGMSSEIQEKIFEPFFTTKKTGEGSGLGLSTVYGIVQQHNGHLDVESREGAGTTVRVLFPATLSQDRSGPEKAVPAPRGGRERVLVVEDEPNVRQLVRDVLEPLGYSLLLAENGKHALEVMEKESGKIDLLLTDVVMPVMTGREFAVHFRSRHPDGAVIFMSGYTDDVISRHGVVDGEEILLQKPVRPESLAKTIRQVLDGECPLKG